MKSARALLVLCVTVVGMAAVAKSQSENEKAKETAQKIENALDMFFVDCHEFPSSLDGLSKAPAACKFWGPDPYLEKIPNDPWGRKWHYALSDRNNFVLKSLGADGKEGGEGNNSDLVIKGTAPKLKKSQ